MLSADIWTVKGASEATMQQHHLTGHISSLSGQTREIYDYLSIKNPT